MKTVVKQDWIESERGWGVRPDGHSLHLSISDLEKFIKKYWSEMPDETPDEYSRPEGRPYLVDVGDEFYKKVKKSGNGIRCYDNNYIEKPVNKTPTPEPETYIYENRIITGVRRQDGWISRKYTDRNGWSNC